MAEAPRKGEGCSVLLLLRATAACLESSATRYAKGHYNTFIERAPAQCTVLSLNPNRRYGTGQPIKAP